MEEYTFEELANLYEKGYTIELNTPHGLKKVNGVHRKEREGCIIEFSDGSISIGAREHRVLSDSEWKFYADLEIGDTFNNTDKTVVGITQIPTQEFIDFGVDYEHECYIQNGITHHNSGKSLIIFILIRWLQAQNKKILLIVPNISLLAQMSSDFNDYSKETSWSSEDNCHLVKAGVEKSSNLPITISTWQSLIKEKRSYYDQYDAVFVDEAHMAKATIISSILNNCNAPYRYAFSGTIDGGKFVNKLTIESLFGPVVDTTTTRNLIDDGTLTETKIKCILLKHKKVKKISYQEEIDYLITNDKRNDFIAKIAVNSSKSGNVLVLFNKIEHGKVLAELINEASDNPVYYIAGEIKGEEREEIRNVIAKENNAILVASYGTLAIGVNMPSLASLIFTHPTKSMIRVVQSIGRILRKADNKSKAVVIDIADDLSGGRQSHNHTLNHFMERVSIYAKQQFSYSLKELKFF